MNTINILIGTKAQFIKVAPLIQELKKQNIPYRLIDTCQHADITENIRKLFKIEKPGTALAPRTNINTLPKAFFWLLKIFLSLSFRNRSFRNQLFGENKKGICLIHGDTLSTLLGLIIAKCYRLKVMHLEAGLRSFHLFDPFPEELIRIICMKFSDYLMAPSSWAVENLRKMKVKGEIYNITANTVLDSINYILKTSLPSKASPQSNYILASVHRFENIYSGKRLRMITKLILRVSGSSKVIFILHQPTIKKLKSRGLYKNLREAKNIILVKITGYREFVSLIQKADFVITDGGSIQEECFYFNKPCLLMRKRTERLYGIKENVWISGFSEEKINRFLANYQSYARAEKNFKEKPSQKIAEILKDIFPAGSF